jgi:hypothetical protein
LHFFWIRSKTKYEDISPLKFGSKIVIISLIFAVVVEIMGLVFGLKINEMKVIWVPVVSLLGIVIFCASSIILNSKVIYYKIKITSLEGERDADKLRTLGLNPIEAYLKKDEIKNPSFFRAEGPLWVDFEKGYVIERKEVTQILKGLEENSVLICGIPASGKSAILGMVGYKLVEMGKKVYAFSFKKPAFTEKFDEIVALLKKMNAYLILDDIHLDYRVAEYFYDTVKSRILLSGRRPEEEINEFALHKNIQEKMKQGIEIKIEEDIKSKIVDQFCKVTGCNFLYEARIELLNKPNHMLLGLQLNAHNTDQGLIKELKPISSSLWAYIAALRNEGVPQAEGIFLPVALFYQFELPIRRSFLSDVLGIDSREITTLSVEKKEIEAIIWRNREYLSLYHSELAMAYVDCFGNFKDLGGALKTKFTGPGIHWQGGCICEYLLEYPEEGNYFIKRMTPTNLRTLARIHRFPSLVKGFIEKAEIFDIECFEAYKVLVSETYDINNIFSEISLSTFLDKITKWDDLKSIAYLLGALKVVGYKNLNVILDNMSSSLLSDKFKGSGNPFSVVTLLSKLGEVGFARVNELEPSLFTEIIKSSHDVFNTHLILDALKEAGYKRFNEFEPSLFNDIIKCDPDFLATSILIWTLGKVGYSKVNKLEPSLFSDMVKSSTDLAEIRSLFEALKEIKYSRLNELEPSPFIDKVKSSYDLSVIVSLLEALKKVSYSNISKILDSMPPSMLTDKMKNSGDLRAVTSFLEVLKEVGYSRLNELEPSLFLDKVKCGHSLLYIVSLLKTLKEVGYSRLDELEPSLFLEKVKSSRDLSHIAWLLKNMNDISYSGFGEILLGISPSMLIEKVESCHDLSDIALILWALKVVGYGRIEEIVDSIPPSILNDQVKKSSDLGEIARLLKFFKEMGYHRLKEVFSAIPPSLLKGKIESSDYPDKILLHKTLEEIIYIWLNENRKVEGPF